MIVISLSCAMSPKPSSPTAAPSATPAADATPSHSPPAGSSSSGFVTAPDRELARVKPASEAACVLSAQEWSPDGEESVLRLRKGGPPFARAAKGSVQLEIPLGRDTDSVFVRLERNGWEIAGHLGTDAFSLRPARAMVFEGFLVPLPLADLRWDEARAGELLVTLSPSRGVKTTATVLRATHPCADVTIDDRSSFDANSVLPPGARRDGVLRARAGIPLSVEAGGAPVAWLDPPNGDVQVQVMESRGAFVRIAWTHFEEIVFGWVPVGDVRTKGAQATAAYGLLGLLGAGGGTSALSSNVTRYRCERDVSLVVDVHGEVVVVGRVLAGTRMDARDRMDGMVRVNLPSTAPVAALPGASFGVPEGDLAGCQVER